MLSALDSQSLGPGSMLLMEVCLSTLSLHQNDLCQVDTHGFNKYLTNIFSGKYCTIFLMSISLPSSLSPSLSLSFPSLPPSLPRSLPPPPADLAGGVLCHGLSGGGPQSGSGRGLLSFPHHCQNHTVSSVNHTSSLDDVISHHLMMSLVITR